MKLTTTLLATLIFASTGALANTTKLTEQDELLIQRAQGMQFRYCVNDQITKFMQSTDLQRDLGTEYYNALNAFLQSDTVPHDETPYSSSTAAIMLVASCIAPARN